MNIEELAKIIDHTLLKRDIEEKDIARICDEAQEWGFYSVLVYPEFVPLAKKHLEGSDIKVCTVVAFPDGDGSPIEKAKKAMHYITNYGADEIDMVMNRHALKEGDYTTVSQEIELTKRAIEKAVLKVILENCYLRIDEIRAACGLCVENRADFVKTSTGFGDYGARAEDVRLMRSVVGDEFGVKAAGGIKSYKKAAKMIKAGANRLGCSRSVSIIKEYWNNKNR